MVVKAEAPRRGSARVCYEPRQTNGPLTNQAGPCPRASSIVHNVRHKTPKWRAIVACAIDALPFANLVSKQYLIPIWYSLRAKMSDD